MKRLSQMEAAELFTIERNEPNRFITIRYNHLKNRGLIYFDNGKAKLTKEGRDALARFIGKQIIMATRYSGDLKITIVYDDRGFYRCSISKDGRKLWRGNVKPPANGFGTGVSYDSEKAYDKVAKAAVSFADNEKRGLGDNAEYDNYGFKIRRIKGYWRKWPAGRIRPKRLSRDVKKRR